MNEFYTPYDIVWIKNVTNKETGVAYMNEPDDFILHISNQFKNEILKPKVGEIILLYQNIRGKGKAFTHLVIPVNNIK